MPSLPTARTLLSDLLSSLPTPSDPPNPPPANPLQDADPLTRTLLITLHVLYPHELLPALDLLDRRLLTRFVVRAPEPEPEEPQAQQPQPGTAPERHPLYFVRSAAPPPSKRSSAGDGGRSQDALPPQQHYEVRPAAWNCSCPAFAFAAFPARDSNPTPAEPSRHGRSLEFFGGLGLPRRPPALPPLCKHLLACVLVERCGVFRACAELRAVAVEELGAWGAGWAD